MHTSNIQAQTESILKDWREEEKRALEFLGVVGDLRFNRGIEIILFSKEPYDARPSQILKFHQHATHFTKETFDITLTLSLVKTIQNWKDLKPSRIDIGSLGLDWIKDGHDFKSLDEFVHYKLRSMVADSEHQIKSKDVVLYGFGRIGRLVARRIISLTGKGDQLRLKAIVIRPKLSDHKKEIEKRMSLFSTDSVHGDFTGKIEMNEADSEVIINGNRIKIIYASSPNEIDYSEYGIKDALLIDNTGVWRDKEALSIHFQPGISKVILTAPGKGIPNIVCGINQHEFNLDEHDVFCAASCTTNAISPILYLLENEYGIEKGHIETVHAYTSDQNLLDNFHKKPRRGRGAAMNMVLTTTGAASAVAKVIPALDGILTGNAVRVPTPNVSLAIMNLHLKKETNIDELQAFLKSNALRGKLVEQIHYSESIEYVSSNAVGMTSTSVIDAPSTIVSHDGRNVTIYAWYDNEYGYTCQVVRLAKHVARVRRAVYY